MKKEKKTLLENFLSLGFIQIFSYLMPLITLPYQTRVLGAEKFGLVYFAYAFMAYFIMLTDFGFGLSATREIAINRHNKNNISNIFSSVMCLKFILVLISYIILVLISLFVPKIQDNWLIFQFSFLMVIGNAIFPYWFFQGMEKMKYITFLNILTRLIFLVSIFVFVKQQSDYIIVPLLNSLGFLVSGIIGMYFAVKNMGAKLYIPSWKSMKKQVKYSSEFFLSRVSFSLYTNTNAFCLGLIDSNLSVGYYVAAEKIHDAINGLQMPINQALYPFVAKYKDIKTYKKWVSVFLICSFLVCSFIFIFAKYFVTIFYGAEMENAYKILRIFCIILLVRIPSDLMGYPLLGAMGHTKIANNTVIGGSIIHITGLFILFVLGKINVYSIALMVLITFSIVLLLRIYYVCKYKLLKENNIK